MSGKNTKKEMAAMDKALAEALKAARKLSRKNLEREFANMSVMLDNAFDQRDESNKTLYQVVRSLDHWSMVGMLARLLKLREPVS